MRTFAKCAAKGLPRSGLQTKHLGTKPEPMIETEPDVDDADDAPPTLPRIDDVFAARLVAPEMMDDLWAAGWRHQGIVFYRYSETDMSGEHHHITPLRIDVGEFHPSKSQRRVLRRNEDVASEFVVAEFDDEVHALEQCCRCGPGE